MELEELEPQEISNASLPSNVAARVSFTTRHSAEKAFLNGKCWQGHNLRFMWITYSNSSKNSGGTANSSAPSDRPSYSNVQSSGEAVSSSGSSKNIGDSGYCAAASNERSDANVQSSGEGVSTLEKTSALGSDKSENPTNGSNVVFVNQDMDSKSSSTTISGEEQLI